MGVAVDLIPLLPGEAPEQAIAQIYEDGIAIRWNGETQEMTLEEIGDGGDPVERVPAGVFDEWRTEVRARRLRQLAQPRRSRGPSDAHRVARQRRR